MNKKLKYKDIHKIIEQEAKAIRGWAKFDEDDNLSLCFGSTQIKNALVMDETTGKPIVRLRSSFIDDLAKIREYAVEGANSLKITITGDCDKETLETFKKAWNLHFGLRIYSKNEDIKELRKKNVFSLALGLLFVFMVAAASISAIIIKEQWLQIFASATDTIFGILAWVFIWEFFYDIFYTLKDEKRVLVSLYIMFKAQFTTNNNNK